jgi:hypothetical protein
MRTTNQVWGQQGDLMARRFRRGGVSQSRMASRPEDGCGRRGTLIPARHSSSLPYRGVVACGQRERSKTTEPGERVAANCFLQMGFRSRGVEATANRR